MGKKEEQEMHRDERIEQTGQLTLTDNKEETSIHLLTIIGEIEGHDNLGSSSKTTKYEHILPQLAAIEDSKNISGLLVLLNTMGGDVEAGLAIAEMIASLSKPTVSLVLGGSHSIGVPIAVSTDYSYIVPSGTMVIHPVRMNGTVIGAQQTYDYFRQIQDRITGFVCEQAVYEGIISSVGGIREAVQKLHELADGYRAGRMKKKNSNSDKKKIK